ncbi:TPA: hypothetical protein LU109_003543 [Enterobacter hormaechei subsp. xiangfangensis]|nr:hypothetical protein [Enterobacter hormaechei subsp. xiangfangensis]
MLILGRQVKKRYLVLGAVVVFMLVKCTGNDDQQAAQPHPIDLQQYAQGADVQRTAPREDDRVYFDQAPAQPAPQPVIVNNVPQQNSDSGFFHGLLTGHLLSGGGRGGSSDSYHRSSNKTTVINKTYVNNSPAAAPAPVAPAPKRYYGRQSPSTSYSTPAPRYMTKTNGYSRPSYASRSRSSSFRARSRR